MTNQQSILDNLPSAVSNAVSHYWRTRKIQQNKQKQRGRSDQGSRSAVTGGAQMDKIILLLTRVIQEAGIPEHQIFYHSALELPGFFRANKEWDLLVVQNGHLLVALEAKSQVGPSFGNNFNNRTEEAMGSALDLWTAFREGAFNGGIQPFVGYFFMLEDCTASQRPVRAKEPHFKVLPEFVDASYAKRYEWFCRKLVRERHYTASAFLTSSQESAVTGHYLEPAPDLTMDIFIRSLMASVSARLP